MTIAKIFEKGVGWFSATSTSSVATGGQITESMVPRTRAIKTVKRTKYQY
jgi:hypothetical protein